MAKLQPLGPREVRAGCVVTALIPPGPSRLFWNPQDREGKGPGGLTPMSTLSRASHPVLSTEEAASHAARAKASLRAKWQNSGGAGATEARTGLAGSSPGLHQSQGDQVRHASGQSRSQADRHP